MSIAYVAATTLTVPTCIAKDFWLVNVSRSSLILNCFTYVVQTIFLFPSLRKRVLISVYCTYRIRYFLTYELGIAVQLFLPSVLEVASLVNFWVMLVTRSVLYVMLLTFLLQCDLCVRTSFV